MCVCCREPGGGGCWERGAGEGAVQGKGPGTGSDPSGPFVGVGGWAVWGEPPFYPPPTTTYMHTSGGERREGEGGFLPIE